MINQQLIKSENKKQIYMLISKNPGISRAKLAQVTRLSKTTVSSLADELIRDGYIVDEGAAETRRQGRKPNSLTVNSKRDCVVVINCRKRTVQIAMVTAAFEIRELEENVTFQSDDYAREVGGIARSFVERHGEGRNLLGICIVVPGLIDSERKRIISMVLPLGENGKLIDELREAIPSYPMAVFNDTACFAYAENAFADMGAKNYVYLNINEGVGASLILDGNLLRGATGMGTQFGHFSIDRDGTPCGCGNSGCLENRIGEIALAKRAAECGALEEFEDRNQILFKDVGRLAAEGNEKAEALVDALASDLAFGLGNLITVFHPETVIIGGMGRKLGSLYLERVLTLVKSSGFRQFVDDVDIRFTTLKEDAVFQGAAKYYLDTHYEFQEDMRGKLFLY